MANAPATKCSGVILAGGLGTRFDGRNKALMKWDGRPLLDHIRQAFEDFFQEIVLVTNAPARFADWDMTLVTDLFDVRSSLTGIHAGLFYASQPFAFVTACDTPFLQPAMIRLLLENADSDTDVVIPQTEMGLEPLCAVYSQRCLQPITQRLQRGDFRIRSFFRQMRIRHVPAERLRQADPDLRSFYNINTPADLAKARQQFLGSPGKPEPEQEGGLAS